MQNLVRLILGDRRRGAVREPVRRTGHLFHEGQPLGQARILDESDTGFRIAPGPDTRRLPDVLTMVEVETALAHEVEVAWRNPDEVGLRILAQQRLRGFVPIEYQPLKEFWEQASVITV